MQLGSIKGVLSDSVRGTDMPLIEQFRSENLLPDVLPITITDHRGSQVHGEAGDETNL